ncbi:MAG: hypothetical protein KDA91_09575, partial [Planctomycetaceae bacterium]|nr:hypothetical protein [Planctomycetaceae bacterium]
SAEGCSDDVDFADRLVRSLKDGGLRADGLQQLESLIQRIRSGLGIRRVDGGLNMELSDAAEVQGTSLGREIESLFRRIEAQSDDSVVIIIVDELPELLLTLSRDSGGDHRAEQFLHWLRRMRQTYRKRIRWMFLGSIGLDTFTDQRGIRKTINDLVTRSVGAYSPEVADRFLEKLGRSNHLLLTPEVRKEILAKVGWPLPYHLQLIFHALVQLNLSAEVTAADVQKALEELLQPGGYGYFDTWRQRLKEQFSQADANAARIILKLLCQHPQGLGRQRLFDELMSQTQADPGETEERLSDLLMILCRDGYLMTNVDRYTFRSFLLREYWYRREVR